MVTHTISIIDMKKEDEEKLSQALHDVWGVRNININMENQEVTISYNEKSASLEDFQQAITESGLEFRQEEY